MTTRAWITAAVVIVLVVTAGIGVVAATTNGPAPKSTHAADTPAGGGGWTPTPTTTPTGSTTNPGADGGSTTTVPATTATTAPPAPPPAPTLGDLVTTAVEQAVVNSTWSSFSNAFAEDDMTAVGSLTTPSALQALNGAYACGCPPWPTAFSSVSYSAPSETSYPLSFLAEFVGKDYDGQPMTKEVVFSQAAANAPWLIAYAGAFYGGTPNMALGINITPTAPANDVPSIGDVAQEFTNYGQAIDSTGTATVPPGIVDTVMLSDTFSSAMFERYGASGWGYNISHSVQNISIPFATEGPVEGNVEACFTLGWHTVVTSAPGKPVVQTAGAEIFPVQLAPGNYSSVTLDGNADLCFAENPDGTADLLTNWGGVYHVAGTPS